jgi:hypothetical protein
VSYRTARAQAENALIDIFGDSARCTTAITASIPCSSSRARSSGLLSAYLEALQGLAPLIAEHRRSFDADRRLPREVFDALADAGLFRLWLPATLGGPELSPIEFMTVVEAASALDGLAG